MLFSIQSFCNKRFRTPQQIAIFERLQKYIKIKLEKMTEPLSYSREPKEWYEERTRLASRILLLWNLKLNLQMHT